MVEIGQLQITHIGKAERTHSMMSRYKITSGIYVIRLLTMVDRNLHRWSGIAISRNQDAMDFGVVK